MVNSISISNKNSFEYLDLTFFPESFKLKRKIMYLKTLRKIKYFLLQEFRKQAVVKNIFMIFFPVVKMILSLFYKSALSHWAGTFWAFVDLVRQVYLLFSLTRFADHYLNMQNVQNNLKVHYLVSKSIVQLMVFN